MAIRQLLIVCVRVDGVEAGRRRESPATGTMGDMSLRAGATVSLSGPLATQGRDAAAGLRAWAEESGAELVLEDDRGRIERVGAFYAERAQALDVVFGPYGSGLTRAAVAALARTRVVLWNHGGAAIDRPAAARVVDVLAPAERYWAGLAETLAAEGTDLAGVVVARGPSRFGRAIGEGAVRSLAAAGAAPRAVVDLVDGAIATIVAEALRLDAGTIAGGASLELDLALARCCHRQGLRAALVGLGITEAAARLGTAVIGGIGPAQWLPEAEAPLPNSITDYPGAQALATGRIAARAIAAAGTSDPDAVWDAARALRTETLLGPFRVDAEGRQVAHAPLLVRWVPGGSGPRRVRAWPTRRGGVRDDQR